MSISEIEAAARAVLAQTREDARLSVPNRPVDVELSAVLQARYDEVERVYDTIEADTGLNYRYQLPSIRRLARAIDRYGGALDASDTGIGKTGVACGVARTLGMRLLVVCPKTVIAPWQRIARLFEVPCIAVNYEALRTGNTPYAYAYKEPYTVAGEQREKKRFVWDAMAVDPEETLIVFDDCHKMKDYSTWNCLMGLQAIHQRYNVLAASATAADNPMQMKFVALLTGLISKPEHFWGWMCDHGVSKGKWGMVFRGGRGVLSSIHGRIFPEHGARIRVEDLGDRFPGTEIAAEAYDMGAKATEEIRAVYAEMRREIARLEERESRDVHANVLVEILRARQRSELLKVPALVEMTQEAEDEGMNVALFLNFDASIEAASRRLGRLGTATITGADRMDERQRVIERFNADRDHVVICNIKAGGVGISLQGREGGRPRLALISPTYSAIDFKQALGRVHRAGGTHSVQKVVFAADTVEEQACAKVRRKLRHIATLNDGDLAV